LIIKKQLLASKIFRSVFSDKEFVEIGEVKGFDSVYIDRTAKPMTKYFYFLQINDQLGEANLQSSKVFGLYKSRELPPPPIYIRYETLANGIKLIWNKPTDYVNSYIIYRNFDNSENLLELKTIYSTDSIIHFIDSSISCKANQVYFYSIRSKNTSEKIGDFSDTTAIYPKINSSIEPPHQLLGYEKDGKVFLYWENLFQREETIQGYKVFRRNLKDSKNAFSPLFDALLSPKQNNYVDTTISDGKEYEYAIKAVDIFNNESAFSSTLKIIVPEIPILPPAGLRAFVSDEGIIISWQSTIQANVIGYKIYRYERGNIPKEIGSVKQDGTEFIDNSALKGNLYFYFIKSVNQNGKESLPSEELSIRR